MREAGKLVEADPSGHPSRIEAGYEPGDLLKKSSSLCCWLLALTTASNHGSGRIQAEA
jgi:hypothetical protein